MGEGRVLIRSRPWAWIAPLAVIVTAVLMSVEPVDDPDTFWHVATGSWLRETWQFTGPDPFSAMASRDWTLHEWLPELVMSLAYTLWGLPGLAMLLPVAVMLITVVVLAVCRRRAGVLIASLVTILALCSMVASLTLRPHLVTFALAAVTSGAWLASADDLHPRWWLVPMTWVWACSHGMWFFGPGLGLVVVAALLVGKRIRARELLRLASVPLASVAAAAFTPAGPALLLAPLAVSESVGFIDEWRRPTFSDPSYLAFMMLVAVAVVSWAGVRRWPALSRIAVLVTAVILGSVYLRTVAVGAAIAAPVAAEGLQAFTRTRLEFVTRRELRIRAFAGAAGVVAVLPLGLAEWQVPQGVPTGLSAELDRVRAGTVVCNGYNYGGWLMWRHPQLRTTIDGRIELYTVDHLRSYLRFARVQPGWTSYLVETGCGVAVLPSDVPAAEALETEAGWTVIAERSGARLLVKPG